VFATDVTGPKRARTRCGYFSAETIADASAAVSDWTFDRSDWNRDSRAVPVD
jgi:hypothetical protein